MLLGLFVLGRKKNGNDRFGRLGLIRKQKQNENQNADDVIPSNLLQMPLSGFSLFYLISFIPVLSSTSTELLSQQVRRLISL